MVPCLLPVMVMRCLGALVASLLLVACPGPGDDPVVDSGTDGNPSGEGLTITFALDTAFPVTTADNTIIDRIDMRATSVRAIGDAAPGDARTTRFDYRLRWEGSDRPEPIRFEDAPVGLYSSVDLDLAADGESVSIEIAGECTRNGSRVDFEIESDAALSIAITTNEMLAPGGAAAIEIAVAIEAAVAVIDWDAQPLDGEGDVVIGDGSAAMTQILAALRTSFSAGAPAAN